jgi:RHS repeat-associated protein
VLAVVTDNINMADDLTTGTVESATDYYPFGLEMAGRTFSAEDYRYGFNGKEKDQNGEFGNTHYDYGFRIYNPEIGKFLSMDPLMKNYPMLTPYQFASNRPIDGIDLDGLEFKRYELPEGSSQVKVMHPDDDAWQPDGWIHYGPSPKITFIQLHGVFDAYDVLSFTSKDGIEFNAELRPTETGRWYFSGYVDDQGNYFKGAANKLIAPYTPKIFIPEYNPDGSKIVHGAVIEFIAAIDFASNFTYGGMSKKGTQKAMNTMVRKAGKWKRLIDLPLQSHHLATKYGSYGRQFKRYFKRYGIGINDEINKLDLPHSGPHPTEYHEAILSKLKEVHKIAQGDVNVFKKEFKKRIKDWVADNPEVIHHTTKSIN